MKNILESTEVFEAYARIDCSYYMLSELQKIMNAPRSAIDRMVDDATGHGQAKMLEHINSAITLMELIIEDKKLIEAPTRKDEVLLKETLKIKEILCQ